MMGLDEFRRYCSENQSYSPAERSFSESLRLMIDKVHTNPSLIGIRGRPDAYRGVSLREGERTIGIVDVVLFDGRGETYLVECNTNPKGRRRGKSERLDDCYALIMERFNVSPQLLFVWSPNGKRIYISQQRPKIEGVLRRLAPSNAKNIDTTELNT